MKLVNYIVNQSVLIGSLHLYTSDLGTTLPPDLGTYTFTYIGFRQNRLRYYMINGTKVHQ